MPRSTTSVRQSVTLPQDIARQVKKLAHQKAASANRVLVELIVEGLEARERERTRFFELVDRLTHTSDSDEQQRFKRELARMTFGD